MISKSLSLLYFFFGLLCGLLIGVALDKRWADAVTRFISTGAIVVIALFWRRIESVAHDRYLENWPVRRSRGKWRFILAEYVLIRGSILLVVTAGPMLPILIFTLYTVTILLVSIATLASLLVYLGSEAWTRCEQDYEIQLLRQAANQSRIESN